jgi:hypothetical protein
MIRLIVTFLTPLLFSVGFVIGFMNTPLPYSPVETDLLPVNRKLIQMLMAQRS